MQFIGGALFSLVYVILWTPLLFPFRLYDPFRRRAKGWLPRPLPTRRRNPAKDFVLLVYYTLLFLCVGEAVIRLTGPHLVNWYSDQARAQMYRPHGRWINYGNIGSVQEFAVDIRLNSLAYHDVDHAVAKPPGTYRILVLGDSFVEAFQVPLEKTFFRMLEAKLNQAGGRRVEIIAMGRGGGVGQAYELALLEQRGLQFQPDLVLVEFLPLNDIDDNQFALTHGVPSLDREVPPRSALVSLAAWPLQYSEFLVFLATKVWAIRDELEALGKAPNDPLSWKKVFLRGAGDTAFEKGWQVAFDAIQKMNSLCASHGAQLKVVSFPDANELISFTHPGKRETVWNAEQPAPEGSTWDLNHPRQRMQEFCRTHSISFINLTPPLAAYSQHHQVRLYFTWDCHMNEHGHQATAEALYESLAR